MFKKRKQQQLNVVTGGLQEIGGDDDKNDTGDESDFLDEFGNIKDSDDDNDDDDDEKSEKEKQSVEEMNPQLPLPQAVPEQRQTIDLSEPRQSILTYKEQVLLKELMIKCSNLARASTVIENDRDFHSLKQVPTLNILAHSMFVRLPRV